jgi:cyanophycinase-like exopeptidase
MEDKKITKNTSVILGSDCKQNERIMQSVRKAIKLKFSNKEKENLKISMIMTARMGFRNKSKNILMNEAIKKCNDWKYAEKLKLPIELIDCSSKINLKKFKKSINSSQIIWVMGGDTLFLWYHLKKTKMDELIKDRIQNHNTLYVGCCAGAIIAGKSIYPTFASRFSKKTNKYYIKNTYKKNFWYKNNNQKTLNLIKEKDVLPHCNSRNKTFKLKRKKIYCLPEYKPLIK